MYVKVDDAVIFTLAFGAKNASPLLALSGWIGSWEDWADTLALLSESWRAVSYDHRGSGATLAPVASLTFDNLVNDVFALMDFHGIERCVLAAMSMGTAVALAAALKKPERFSGLVIVNGAHYRETPLADDPFYQGLQHHYPQTLDYFSDLCLPEPDSDAIKYWGRQILDRATQPAALALYQMASSIDLRPKLSEITLPTLILHGDADPIVTTDEARRLADSLPNAELVLLEGAGHVPIMTRPLQVAAEISRYFGS